MVSGFPEWLIKRLPPMEQIDETNRILGEFDLTTVCHSALCPNIGDCFSQKHATFLIMGEVCTRACRFCAIKKGTPPPLDSEEPLRTAQGVRALNLKHVIVTSVTRDDLSDGGAGHFVAVVKAIRQYSPQAIVEVLTSDFDGNPDSINTMADARPEVFGHNVETIARLYKKVRPIARYDRSLRLLEQVKSRQKGIVTKSGIMVGLGETTQEVKCVLQDLRDVRCDIVTIGQYLSPSRNHLGVEEFIHPSIFEYYRKYAEGLGFHQVVSGPFVRSSSILA